MAVQVSTGQVGLTEERSAMALLTKSYPVLDCDAHVTETTDIWNHMSEKEREFAKQWFWPDGPHLIVNGNRTTFGNWAVGRSGNTHGFHGQPRRLTSAVEASGPGVNKKVLRKLWSMELTHEQVDYTDHAGARDPRARLRDMEYMGIDQMVGIPNQMVSAYLWVENYDAAALVARAYNDYIDAWCSADPQRLFGAAVIPVHNPVMAAAELRRVARKGFRLAMVRPVDIQGRYPNQAAMDPVWRAFEDTGLVVAIHGLVFSQHHLPTVPSRQWTPGHFTDRVVNKQQIHSPSQSQSFIGEAMIWLANVLLSGFLERYRGITRMAMMECNAGWLPTLLEQLDKAFVLYRNERALKATRLPSEMFPERCFIAFEGDEKPVYRQHQYYEDLGIWSSDVYHLDGADAWTAVREMEEMEVPVAVQEKLMGGNARRMYAIEAPKTWMTRQAPPPPRPDWYPKMEDTLKEYAPRMVRS